MSVYTVHKPPLKADESSPDPERFVFVRDGLSIWAALLAPLWMLWHRMWLVLLGYVAVVTLIKIGMYFIGASNAAQAVIGVLLSLLVGVEAGTLRRFTLGRRGWTNIGTVVADDRDLAERRFFDSWVKREASQPPPAPPLPVAAALRMPSAATEVIGLFPEPGAPR